MGGGMKAAACLQRYYEEDQVTEEAMQLHNAYGHTILISSLSMRYLDTYFIFQFHFLTHVASRTEEEKKRGVSSSRK
jgi:hypothetical protein